MNCLSRTSEADREEYESMLAEIECGECVTISEKDDVFFCGKFLGRIGKDFSERFVLFRIKQEMRKNNFFPNIYRVNDHGNVSLLDSGGREVKGWV